MREVSTEKEKEEEKENGLVYSSYAFVCGGSARCHAGLFFYDRIL